MSGVTSQVAAGTACKKFTSTPVLPFVAMSENVALQKIAPLIHEIRGKRVILDSDLAKIYGVTTKRLNEQVKRNADRFSRRLSFELSKEEWQILRSQTVISKSHDPKLMSQVAISSSANLTNRSQFATGSQKHRDPRYLPRAFTEHGAIMAANVLNSKQAVQMSVFVVRAFVKLREVFATHKELTELERKLGTHDKAIVSIIVAIRGLTEPPGEKRGQSVFEPGESR